MVNEDYALRSENVSEGDNLHYQFFIILYYHKEQRTGWIVPDLILPILFS